MQPLRIVTATASALLMVSLTLVARQAPPPQLTDRRSAAAGGAAPAADAADAAVAEQRLGRNGPGAHPRTTLEDPRPQSPEAGRRRPRPQPRRPSRGCADSVRREGSLAVDCRARPRCRRRVPRRPPAAGWKVENGYMEVTPGVGGLTSKERFKDFQLHVEFASPAGAARHLAVSREQRHLASAAARSRSSTTTTTRPTPTAMSRRSTTSGRHSRIRHGRPANGRRWTSPTWRRDTTVIGSSGTRSSPSS